MLERITPLTGALIVANVLIFALVSFLDARQADQLFIWFALWPPEATLYTGDRLFEPWQLLTYGFLHGGFMHLFFNMFALYMFGPDLERLFGTKRYAIYYFFCVIGAALMHLIVMGASNIPPGPMVGASGAVFGLLLAYAMAWPHRQLMLLFPPIPMPAWLFVTLYGILELWSGVTQTSSGVAHFAHLGGLATGWVLIRYWRAQARRR
jgi:membrane associated rhomboid family serine protease